jgi:hypothetical protein
MHQNRNLKQLQYIGNGDQVILDEVGDATNGPTGRLFAELLLPELRKRNCRTLITTHNDAVEAYLEEQGAICLTTSSNTQGIQKFKVVPKNGKPQYHQQQILQEVGWTKTNIKKLLGSQPNQKRRPVIEEVHRRSEDKFGEEKEFPF